MITVAPVPDDIPEYERVDWKHWKDYDNDCQTIRHEVFVTESLIPVTSKTDEECQAQTGRWFDAFSGRHLEYAGYVDDIVLLQNVHLSGEWA